MILAIYTLDQSRVQLALVDQAGGILQVLRKTVRGRQTEMVTPAIDELLKKTKTALSDITGMVVASGPGGFTAVRSGVVVANALGFAFGVPVVGVEGEFAGVDELLSSNRFTLALKQLKRAPATAQARPSYGANPNISQAKHKKVQQHKLKV